MHFNLLFFVPSSLNITAMCNNTVKIFLSESVIFTESMILLKIIISAKILLFAEEFSNFGENVYHYVLRERGTDVVYLIQQSTHQNCFVSDNKNNQQPNRLSEILNIIIKQIAFACNVVTVSHSLGCSSQYSIKHSNFVLV